MPDMGQISQLRRRTIPNLKRWIAFIVGFRFNKTKEGMLLKETQEINIFVVDDEPVFGDSPGMILRVRGFTATSFTNPLEALNWSLTLAPDLLVKGSRTW
jgi:hypothetical protein